MTDLLDQVLRDLDAEGAALETMLAPLDDAAWSTPTPAVGWTIATQVAHLALTDEVAVVAAADKQAWDELVLAAIGDPEGFVGQQALEGAKADPADLLERWRRARPALQEALRDYVRLLPVGPSGSMKRSRYRDNGSLASRASASPSPGRLPSPGKRSSSRTPSSPTR